MGTPSSSNFITNNEDGIVHGKGIKNAEQENIMSHNSKQMLVDSLMLDISKKGHQLEWSSEVMNMDDKMEKVGPKQSLKSNIIPKSQISYKAKLLGNEEKTFDKNLEEKMEEWLQEEEEASPELTDEHKKIIGSIPKLNISDERLKELCKPWKDALILTVVGKKTNLVMMKDRVKSLLRSNNFELIDLPNYYYVFRTAEEGLCNKLMFDGPWLIQGHYLAVQRWSPNFNPYCNKVRKVAVWIRIPTLPLHMYSEECMLEIGNLIGRALKVDLHTLAQRENNQHCVERGKYARVSVEIDLNKHLQARFSFRNKIYPVEYEGLDTICFSCGIYGHIQEVCPQKLQKLAQTTEQGESHMDLSKHEENKERKQLVVSVPGIPVEEEYGAWMKVTRTKYRGQRNDQGQPQIYKQNGNGRISVKQTEKLIGTRFDVLRRAETENISSGEEKINIKKGNPKQWRKKEIGENSNTKEVMNSSPVIENIEIDNCNTKNFEKATKQIEKETNSDINIEQRCGKLTEPILEMNKGRKKKDTVSKKKGNISVTKVIPNMLKKKKVSREHKIVFGSLMKGGSSVINQMLEQVSQSADSRYTEMRAVDQVHEERHNSAIQNHKITSQAPEHEQSLDDISVSHVSSSFNEIYIQNDMRNGNQDEAKENVQGVIEDMELSASGH